MSNKLYGETYRTIRLCINSYEQEIPKGWLYHPGLEREGIIFNSLTQMLKQIDQMLDKAHFPQSFTTKRSFTSCSSDQTSEPPALSLKTGKVATFVIRILFRQHTSWQGSVTWLERQSVETFRSVLELIFLMDSALNGKQSEQAG